ncbi:MAG: hypothetical protein TR69_WS6001001406 [candidate division WS6 bacterium OLB20]|uniref:Uncharacterized protein n=1 Tax=candidate division WS6 bacterium OLB20 TaxID=1617426 RepID=A0A136LVW3_9BACT|nr:MAG: hypothetical protein TR69_WS6001001406 [candidate division WS6 bacterium OLB20]
MAKQLVFVYDNRAPLEGAVKTIVGLSNYGDIVYRRHSVAERALEVAARVNGVVLFRLDSDDQTDDLLKLLEEHEDRAVVHFYSSTVISDEKSFTTLLAKCAFVNETMIADRREPRMVVLSSVADYRLFLAARSHSEPKKLKDEFADTPEIEPHDCLVSISRYENFLQFFSGAFDARHFNSFDIDDYTVTKTFCRQEQDEGRVYLLSVSSRGSEDLVCTAVRIQRR